MKAFFTLLFFTLLLFNTLVAQDVVIQEVLYNPASGVSQKIALRNVSAAPIDVSNWCLCNRPAYRTIGTTASFNVLSGDPTALGAGEDLILELTGSGFVLTNDAEIALYHNNGCSGYNNSGNLEDFVGWGMASGGTRQSVAVAAGLWTSGDFVPGAAVGEIMVFSGTSTGGGNNSLSSDYSNQTSGLLPVELIAFNVTANEDRVSLQWSTASELNSEFFIVERSLDGMRYEEITRIMAAGTTNQTTQYSYDDLELFTDQTVYYRLKQIDFDGSLFCSSVKAINVQAPAAAPTILMPNPISHKECMSIKLGPHMAVEEVEVIIYNFAGQPVLQKTFGNLRAFGYEVFIDFPGMMPGSYQVAVIYEGQVKEVLKLVLI